MANNFKLFTAASISNSALTEYYEVPSSTTAVVLGITIANKSSAAVTVSIQIFSDTADHSLLPGSANADSYLVKDAPIAQGGSTEIMEGNKLVLQTTDGIKAIASASGAVDLLISVMEIT
jgi:hypothetical protein|tara:strand:+ start:610 stop:969 length:360 start_codon:yes stop_codon:yes gene_type:complete